MNVGILYNTFICSVIGITSLVVFFLLQETRKKRVSALEKKLDKLGSFQKKLEELNNEDKRINMVDPDAPIMTHKDGQKLPSYTHQSARDGKCGVVTAVQSTQKDDLPKDLLPLVDQSIENTGQRHEKITADQRIL